MASSVSSCASAGADITVIDVLVLNVLNMNDVSLLVLSLVRYYKKFVLHHLAS